ncbi:hypothetical protein F5B20DRAFT_589117 [Whalleya microplaca]|nr:hypothetical protein F5B20DRAFT_589117 [Whalleya microplaca]
MTLPLNFHIHSAIAITTYVDWPDPNIRQQSHLVCTWISRWALRRNAPNQARSTVSVLSSHNSPTAISTSEVIEPQEPQVALDPQELQKPQAQSLGLLPTELILLVSELLPVVDAVCLALTCKRMCYILNIRELTRRLDAATTEALLCRLEKEITGVSYCPIDQMLARFTTCTMIRRRFKFHHHTVHKARGPLDVHFGYSLLYLPWCVARLVTNYQIRGPQHGLPASTLDVMYDHQYPEHGVCWREAWAAKVIHGELLMSCTHTIFQKGADTGNLQTYFNTNTIALCCHIAVGRKVRYKVHVGLPANMTGNIEHHDMGRCWRCETDWETSIEWTNTELGWTITARTYHGLGTCRSSHDPKWQAMAYKFKPFRALPVRAVKALWETL